MEYNKNKSNSKVWIIVVAVITIMVIYLMLGVFLSPMYVEGESMSPTLSDSKMIFVQKALFAIEYDTVLIFKRPNEDYDCVKRVVGMPGDRVAIENGKLMINGKVAADKFGINVRMNDYSEVTLNEKEYFMLGDNRDVSVDSRAYGAVPKDNIIGKCLFVK